MPEFAAFLMSSRQKNGSGLLLLRFCLLEERIAQTHVKNTLPRDPNSVRPILWKIVVVYVVVVFYATLCLGRRTWRWFSSLRKLSKKAPSLLRNSAMTFFLKNQQHTKELVNWKLQNSKLRCCCFEYSYDAAMQQAPSVFDFHSCMIFFLSSNTEKKSLFACFFNFVFPEDTVSGLYFFSHVAIPEEPLSVAL